jgi:single-strand DNA-binding protein
VNKVTLMGRLGMDPELRHSQAGGAVLRLRMATTDRYVDKSGERQERTEWHTVVFFGNRAEGLAKHLGRGDGVCIEGRLQTREWEDKEGNKRYTTEIVGREFHFPPSSKGGGQRSDANAGYGGRQAPEPSGGFGDDIPFAAWDERL